MNRRNFRIRSSMCIVVGVLIFAVAGNAVAQGKLLSSSVGLYVYPANGQAPEQQSKDDYECYHWAQEQTGHDPANPQPINVQAAPTNTGPDGSVLRGAARGAVVGEVVNDDAGKGAAWGAAAGAVRGQRKKKAQAQQAQASAEAQTAQMEAERTQGFNNAFSSCLTARGYSVN